jgi:hypothetical protein
LQAHPDGFHARFTILLGFKSYNNSARSILAGIELMHMIRKPQMVAVQEKQLSFAVVESNFVCSAMVNLSTRDWRDEFADGSPVNSTA